MASFKTIRVSPELAAQMRRAVNAYRMTFRALDRPGSPTLRLPYNPESYEIRPAPRWTPQNGAGAEFDNLDWEGNSPRVLSYSHLLTTQNTGREEGGDVESVIRDFDLWSTQPTLATQRPTRVRVTAGEAIEALVGVITSVSYRRVQTSPEGRAITAEFEVEITENERAF